MTPPAEDEKRSRARELRSQNWLNKEIAAELGVSRRTIAKWLGPKNPNHRESKRESHVRHKYGVDLATYRARMKDGECKICGTKEDLVYDHDHETSAFRGVLCRYHNKVIGGIGDTAADAWKIFRYLIGVPTRPDKHAYFMMIAAAVAARSDCRRAKVGAVVVRPDGTLAGTGYVGTKEHGQPGCLEGACPRGRLPLAQQLHGGSYENCISRHSEDNAIRHSYGDLTGCTIYVTREPCATCHELIRQAGISNVFWPGGYQFYGEHSPGCADGCEV